MTVTYSEQMSQKKMCSFLRLLLLWKGSIFKLIIKEMLIYWLLYFLLFVLHKNILTDDEKVHFNAVCSFFRKMTSYIPLDFVLGFYVIMIVERWWSIFSCLAWPDSTVYRILMFIPYMDDRSRLIRRSLVRWLNLSFVLILRSCSSAVRKRFPTMEHIEAAGFILREEIDEVNRYKHISHIYWVPLKWGVELCGRARVEERLPNDRFLIELVTQINEFRATLGTLLDYDWVSVPLVYTQVVTLGVYSFFLATLFGRQPLDDHKDAQLLSPILSTTMQFLFYMGWLKVAESLINPLGEDDDDFELNWLIDRNIKFSYMVIDDMFGQHPALKKDMFWDEENIELPYTEASKGVKDTAPVTSTEGVTLTEDEAKIVAKPFDSEKPLTFKEKVAEKLGILSADKNEKGKGSGKTPISRLASPVAAAPSVESLKVVDDVPAQATIINQDPPDAPPVLPPGPLEPTPNVVPDANPIVPPVIVPGSSPGGGPEAPPPPNPGLAMYSGTPTPSPHSGGSAPNASVPLMPIPPHFVQPVDGKPMDEGKTNLGQDIVAGFLDIVKDVKNLGSNQTTDQPAPVAMREVSVPSIPPSSPPQSEEKPDPLLK